ncbi:Preprotein translocase subunit SecE [Corynebacterium kutscheri]|uniref:Protein translocase subunit SecE n=1 Tax=Corynebacterium kutscheri TaxID=35755 RepID=A0A0F6TCZ9_9CORY|nr:preprotein translocase subunit SecE [Corynebacterium kutscheri]AKE40511.1 preprotein translocase, SecE subunit [Corynebacterium kutscheri]VEH05057.1 Preprotein translocase subunit SecE [Corynebacterium kutscheri]VEH10906.1 Preprotein translocase subunit SecE [Corynebacterium kutscheri]VEH80618.1 Preprotein translocase subunit SecE [Corynebacterium kutscheri]
MTEEQPEKASAARPTGKRQLAGVSTTSTAAYEAKQVAPAGDGEEKTGNKVLRFFPEVATEIRKVIWPTAAQMVNYTIIVFAFLIILTALVAGVDFLAGLGVEKVLTP